MCSTVLLSIVSCTKIAPHGTILTSAVVTLYASYLCYSALASNPDKHCNPLAEGSMESGTDLFMGLRNRRRARTHGRRTWRSGRRRRAS